MNTQRTISICATNVQRLHNDRKRLTLFTRWARMSHADLFLLSEVGDPSPENCRQWTEECRQLQLDAIFRPQCRAAIVWRPASPFFQGLAPSDVCQTSEFVNRHHSVDAKFNISGTQYFVMAIYVPVSPIIRPLYLRDLTIPLSRALESHEAIIGGDWNVVPDAVADSSRPDAANVGEGELHQLLTACHLQDSYRVLNPRKPLFTNKGSNGTDRRLDQIYISRSMMGGVSSFTTWERYQSSHSPIMLRWIVPGAVPIGPSWFKLGRHLTDDPTQHSYLQFLTSAALETASLMMPAANPVQRWQLAKTLLLPKLDVFSRRMAIFRRRTGLDADTQHEGLSTRARLPAELSGLQSVHIRLKQVREQDIIPSLKSADGRDLTHAEDMLEEARSFFGDLYQREAVDPIKKQTLLTSVRPRLTTVQIAELERRWKKKEILEALKKSNKRSSPGPDGLPFGFYEATWSVTGPVLKEILNFLSSHTFSPSHMTNIVLLHKKGEKDQLSNKRPISLINTDERIMDRAINSRLAPVLPSILHPTQTGFVPGRWIGTNIETVQNAIDDGDLYPGALAVIDFEKAYDRVDHSYLLDVLKTFGLGPRFIRLVMAMTTGSQARICLNGWMSSSFELQRGLRQGSPLAPSLFTLCIEPLAARLRSTVTGIRHTGLGAFQETIQPLQTLLFADDLVVGLRDPRDLEKAEHAFDLYRGASGGKVSTTKSFLHRLGAANPHHVWPNWTISSTPFRYLGVQVGQGVQSDQIWASLVASVKARMRSIPMFDLPIAARCSIINIYCFSKVLYLDQFMPALPCRVNELMWAAVDTIWAGKQRLVSKPWLFKPKENGGYGLLRLDYQFDCARAKWIAALLSTEWRSKRYLGALRRRICQYIQTEIRKEAHTAEHQHWFSRVSYDPETIERQYVEHTWVATFGQPSIHRGAAVHSPLETGRRITANHLPERWQLFLMSWQDHISLFGGYQSRQNWKQTFLDERQRAFDSQAPLQVFHVRGLPRMGAEQISLARKALVNLESPLTIPYWDIRLVRAQETWKDWWTVLQKVRSRLPDEEDSFHLYVINHLSNPRSWIRAGRPPDPRWPQNVSRSCILCLQDVDESWDHVLHRCRVGRALWRHMVTPVPQPRTAAELVSIDDPCPMQIAFAACYVHFLYKLLRRRRLAPLPPERVDRASLKAEGHKIYMKAIKLQQLPERE